MPYLGNAPAEAYSQISYQDLTGGSGTSFTLDYPAGSAGEIEVFVNNVRQEPTVAYTVSGTSLTMTGSISATDDFYVVFQGKAQQSIGIPEKQTDGTYVFPDDVLVGKSSASTSTVGVEALANGEMNATVSGGRVGLFNRLTSDGDIVQFRKDSTTVGSIGVLSSRMMIGTDDVGLFFDSITDNAVEPSHSTTGPNDGVIDLGSSGARFKDLYLSGGVYLGGTGSANYLDDIETGTFTPTAGNGTLTFNRASYTKIGNLVFISIANISLSDYTSGSSVQIGNLPFASSSATGYSATGSFMAAYRDTTTAVTTYISAGADYLRFYDNSDTSAYGSISHGSMFSNSSNSMYLSITYQTDS